MISSARTVKMMSLTFEGSNIVVVIATVYVNTVSVLFTKVFFLRELWNFLKQEKMNCFYVYVHSTGVKVDN